MRILLSTGCLYENPPSDVFKIASVAGYDGIEWLVDNYKSIIPAHNIKKMSDDYGVPVVSVHSPFMICDGWGGFWERIQRSIKLAIDLSSELVNFHPHRSPFLYHRLDEELQKHISDYKNRVKNHNIALTIENLPCPKHLRIIPFLDRLLSPLTDNTNQLAQFAIENRINITFDTTHAGTTGHDILNIYDVFKDRIANIHLSDYDGEKQHLLPGEGHLPLKDLLSRLKANKYDGIITLETNPAVMEPKDISKATQKAKQCLLYIKNALGIYD